MDSATCNVIYVDRNVDQDRVVRFSSANDFAGTRDLRHNLVLLTDAFGEVFMCQNGAACMAKLLQLNDNSMVELKPTLILLDTPHDEQVLSSRSQSRDPSPYSRASEVDSEEQEYVPVEELYGVKLLERIVYETHLRSLSKLVVPIPIVTFPLLQSPPPSGSANNGTNDTIQDRPYANYLTEPTNSSSSRSLTSRGLLRKCLDSGAVDVLASPLHMKTLTTLEVHAYRAHKEAAKEQQALLEIRRGRKRSWVGVHNEKPFAYLREAMVSGLMSGICRTGGVEDDDRLASVKMNVAPEYLPMISESVGMWHFSAHVFCDDSLLIASMHMFEHALSMPELERWRIPEDQLTTFLVACRAAYNTFVPYHNFRHAVDVLQATFHFLVSVGALPPYRAAIGSSPDLAEKSPLASLLGPFEALTLLISAIGHDVGHPGVNNGFLITLNAPLAQLYNDRSVLESFHCAAYSQILRRHWPRVFEDDKMRNLMVSSILATDMGLHFDYMNRLNDLQDTLRESNSTDGWSERKLDEHKALACSLLIKCADISNVAREYEAALQWMNILCDEFSRQAAMEKEIGIPSSLISQPKKEFISLAKAQLGFVNMFAIPLFRGVADVLPTMRYTIDELKLNKGYFEKIVEDIPEMPDEMKRLFTQEPFSEHTMSLVVQRKGDERPSTETAKVDILPEHHAELKTAASSPPHKRSPVPNIPSEYKETNGMSPLFASVADFAASDPFNSSGHENRIIGHNGKQRSSETTDGSSSVPGSSDWHSQATSATTGKMPLSPSTQGTSIVSEGSMERPTSNPTTVITKPDSHNNPMPVVGIDSVHSEDSNGNTIKPDRSLRKKTSRFRMNVSTFFRRNRGHTSPTPVEAEVSHRPI